MEQQFNEVLERLSALEAMVTQIVDRLAAEDAEALRKRLITLERVAEIWRLSERESRELIHGKYSEVITRHHIRGRIYFDELEIRKYHGSGRKDRKSFY